MPLMWEYGNSTTYYSEWFIGDVVSDDALKGGQNLSDMADAYDMENFKTNTNNKLLLGFFRAQWQGVQRANLAIESVNGLALDDSFTQELKDRLIAEATFLRAMYYFRLVRVYGGMPLIDYVVESSAQWNQERATRDATLQFIIRDLEACVEVLPLKSKYPIDDMGRATRGAAQAMLLKANLYRAGFLAQEGGDATAAYREAKKWGEEIMSTNEYDLVPNYFDQFLLAGENGKESVFEIQYTEDGRSDYGEGEGFTLGTFVVIMQRPRTTLFSQEGWGFDRPSWNLYNEYEEGDPRRDATILNPTEQQIEDAGGNVINYQGNYLHNRKYAMYTDGTTVTMPYYNLTHHTRGPINNKVIRYSDVLLMYAEACVELGDLPAAKLALNRVRSRVGLPAFPYSATIQGATVTYGDNANDLRAAVRHERRVELAMEGHRWFDLLRWGIAKQTMDAYFAQEAPEVRAEAAAFQVGKHELMPIPSDEILLSGISQNPGY
ncbi:MAG: RagB/SusD family nutrient uptake outer membrane protein [Muribaculaceae bacterium]|nr:RagB/SusD family nutrient uptake outer membrane protein [Muribaculaceae bacterium]